MPIYRLRCDKGHLFDKFMSIAQMEDSEHFCECQAPARVQIVPTMLAPMFTPYTCPITDEPITTLKAHQENLKKHGCRVLEPGEKDEVVRFHKENEQKLDKEVEQTATQFIDKLNGDQRSQLVNEIQSGLDVQIVRKGN